MTDLDTLTEQWVKLRQTWPSDGWDGAAAARGTHDAKVRACETSLAALHEQVGHGPFQTTPAGWRPTTHHCICQDSANHYGQSAPGTGCTSTHINDPRHLGHATYPLVWTEECPGGLV